MRGGAFKERIPITERFWSKVQKTDGCWLWTAFRNPCGYGMFGVGSRTDGSRHHVLVHRWAYESVNGPIPNGLEIDHLCRIRNCVNPTHLRAVVHQENMPLGILRGLGLRNKGKTHCPQGHTYDAENTYVVPEGRLKGGRKCRICNTIWQRALRQRRTTHQHHEVGCVASVKIS